MSTKNMHHLNGAVSDLVMITADKLASNGVFEVKNELVNYKFIDPYGICIFLFLYLAGLHPMRYEILNILR